MLHSATQKKWPESLWRGTAPKADSNAPLDGDVSADVTIIGAGFTGLRAALFLVEAGVSVAVVDAGDVGYGASGRTGGQVNPMMPFNSPEKLRKIVGTQYFDRLTETSLNSADELFDLIEKYQLDSQARQKGWLRVAHSPAAQKKAVADAMAWNAHGANMHQVGEADVKRLSGAHGYASGIVAPKGGAIHPYAHVCSLAKAAKDRGAKIFGQTAVQSLKRKGDKWAVQTPNGTVTSDWVILATNAYSDDLFPKVKSSVLPLVSIQMATDPLPDEVFDQLLPEGHTISDTRRVIMFARREPDNRFVYGSAGRLSGNEVFAGFEWLKKDVDRVYPQLKNVNWSYKWGGQIAITQDRVPHIHEPKPGLIAGLGYNGRGVAMSHVMGRVMAERVLGADAKTLPLPVTDINRMPFRMFQTMGKGTAVRWMRFLDYLETR